jgi:hypothetical protein
LAVERSAVTTERSEDQVVVLKQRVALHAVEGLGVHRLEVQVLDVVIETLSDI